MKKFILTPLAAAVLSASAYAADEAPKTFTLDKVTVAATLNEQKISDVANTVSVVDAEEIERIGATDVRQMLRYEPGVEVATAGGRFGLTSINIRGQDRNKVKIVVDGIDQAKVLDQGSGYFQSAGRLFVDMDSLKQVEVVRGPASSLYGSNAIGGVVSFTTKDPSDFLSAEGNDTAASIKTAYTSADSAKHGTLTLANRTGDLETLMIYTQRSGEEFENFDEDLIGGDGDDRTEKDPVDFESDNLLLKAQYQLSEDHRIGLTFEDYNSTDEGALPSKNGPWYADYYGDNTKDRTRISVEHTWDAQLGFFDKLDWSLAYQDSETNNISSQTTLFGFPTPRIKDYTYSEELTQFTATFAKSLNNHQLTYGVNYEEVEYESESLTIYPNNPAGNTSDRYLPLLDGTAYGVFIQDEITLLDGNLTLTPSIRYDDFEHKAKTDSLYSYNVESQDHDNVSIRIGAVYDLTENFSVFSQYAQGFKTPDLQDIYYTRVAGYVILANPDLKPEESDSYEIGVRYKNSKGNIELTAFYNDYDDYIDQRAWVDGGTTYYQDVNIAKATIKGIELRGAVWLDEAMGAPVGTSMQFSVAYAEGMGKQEASESAPLGEIAPLKGVIGLNYDSPNNLWGGSVDWTLVDDKESKDLPDDSDFAPHGFGLLDLSAYYNVNENLVLRANINNLTDKKYWLYEDVRDFSSTSNNLDRYTQPGRNFNISATYTF
jgi:hemoglobin/transferrin/lactoferrin receptor protein